MNRLDFEVKYQDHRETSFWSKKHWVGGIPYRPLVEISPKCTTWVHLGQRLTDYILRSKVSAEFFSEDIGLPMAIESRLQF